MACITDLPVEILHHIVRELTPDHHQSLSSFSRSCKGLYVQLLPRLYHTLHIRFYGPSSWGPRTDTLKLLTHTAGPAKVKTPDATSVSPAIDRKGKGVPGRAQLAVAKLAGRMEERWLDWREGPLEHVREVVLDGFWMNKNEAITDEYWPSSDGVVREHQPFVEALEKLLLSLNRLDAFTWKITRILPASILAALSQFDTLSHVTMHGDSHMYSCAPTYPYQNVSTLWNNPTMLSHNRLVTLRALQTGDINQVISYGDVIRTPSTWESLRNLEFDISPGFQSMLVELEPLEPDLLGALFRPPPPERGQLTSPKLQLHQLKLREIAFQPKGIAAVADSIDPSALRDLDFYYCQEGTDLLRRWEKNMLPSLERLHIKEELMLNYLCKFLRQFGPEGTCRSLKTLELCCWHVDHWTLVDSVYPDNDDESDLSDDGMYGQFDSDDDGFECHCPAHSAQYLPKKRRLSGSGHIPQPWRSMQELRGSQAEGWGLERVVLDMRPGVTSITGSLLPHQELFFDGFWRLKELAVPVAYEPSERWNGFIATIAALPQLESLFMLNARGERSGPRPYIPFPALPPTPDATVPFGTHSSPRRSTGRSRKKQKEPEPEVDKVYVDALAIAARNRLSRHGTIPTFGASSSSAATAGQNWLGKLRYIGVRSTFPVVRPNNARVWRVEMAQDDHQVVEQPAAARRRSLRSSKRRKVETGDWKTTREGDWAVRLDEMHDDDRFKVANGLFKGMERMS